MHLRPRNGPSAWSDAREKTLWACKMRFRIHNAKINRQLYPIIKMTFGKDINDFAKRMNDLAKMYLLCASSAFVDFFFQFEGVSERLVLFHRRSFLRTELLRSFSKE